MWPPIGGGVGTRGRAPWGTVQGCKGAGGGKSPWSERTVRESLVLPRKKLIRLSLPKLSTTVGLARPVAGVAPSGCPWVVSCSMLELCTVARGSRRGADLGVPTRVHVATLEEGLHRGFDGVHLGGLLGQEQVEILPCLGVVCDGCSEDTDGGLGRRELLVCRLLCVH